MPDKNFDQRIITTILLWLVTAACCAAQDTIISPPLFEVTALGEDTNDLALVSQWLEYSAQFNDRILATVYWSLGTLVTTMAIILGIGWFNSSRAYERDKDSLSSTLRAEIAAEIASFRDNLTQFESRAFGTLQLAEKKQSDFEATMRSEQAASWARIRAETEAAGATQKQEIAMSLRKSQELSENSIRIAISNLDAQVSTKINSSFSSISLRMDYAELANLKFEILKWTTQGVPSNVLAAQIRVANKGIEMDLDYIIKDAIEEIERIVSASGTGSYEPELVDMLSRLKGQFAPTKARIFGLVSRPKS